MSREYQTGATLEVRGETWTLARVQPFDACTVLTLEGRDRSNAGDRLQVIEPFDRPRLVANRKLRRRRRQAVIAGALTAIAAARDRSGLWTAASASIDLWPYQLEPALAVIHGATRLLLADAVGLGKTIQAGLILSELGERGWVEHALIACPAGVRDTWARELRDRFGIVATVLDQPSIAERIASLPPGVSPWSGHAVAIASIDFLKRPEVLSAIDNEPIDLVIADEAHHLAPGTDRGAAMSRIASRAPWCVLVSATPHSGDRAAFEYLTSMGANGDPIAIFRRHRRDVGLAVSRRSHVLGVHATVEEAALMAAIENYARAIWIARGREDSAVRLIAMTMARRAASSAAAIRRTLGRRLALLSNVLVEPAQSLLPWEEVDRADEIEADVVLAARGLESVEEERVALERLIELAARCERSSKIDRLRRFLDRSGERAVVFTEYRDTLDAIVSALAGSARRVASIHGGLTTELRRATVDAFNDGGIDVLVATDTAGEGLSLHHRCRLVIDVEVPWNPLRLEQRVGRVDRLGQRRTVHAIRLFHPGTIESAVLDRLRVRLQRAEDAFAQPIRDHDMAAAIFDGASPEPDNPGIRPVVIDSAREEARRIEWQRRLLEMKPLPARSWTPPRHHESTPLIVLHRIATVNDADRVVDERCQASRIEFNGHPEDRRRWRQLIERIDSIVPRQHAEPSASPRSVERRITAIRERLRRQRAFRYQRSLFDRRADADWAARQAIVDRLDAALVRTLRSVAAPIASGATRIDLIAAWPERRQ